MPGDVAPDGSRVEVYLRLPPSPVPAMLHAAMAATATVLGLGRRFGAVLAASHLINAPDPHEREALLATCRRHVEPDGVVLVERHPPGWATTAEPATGRIGDVEVELHRLDRNGLVLSAAVTYRVDGRSYTQRFTAADVDDATLDAAARASGLEVVRALDAERTWLALAPVRGSSAGSSPRR